MAGTFLTIDYVRRPEQGVRQWNAAWRSATGHGIEGLEHGMVARVNRGTMGRGWPSLVPAARTLVLAWSGPEAAHRAWAGPLAPLVAGRDRMSLDAELVRVRSDHAERGGDHWHGWRPTAGDAAPIADDEPVVALIHGMLRPATLVPFVRANFGAARRLTAHEGVHATMAISSRPPLETTSLSCWGSAAQMRAYAYAPGGHADAMRGGRAADWHRTTLFLQARPLACSGTVGRVAPAFPALPAAPRG